MSPGNIAYASAFTIAYSPFPLPIIALFAVMMQIQAYIHSINPHRPLMYTTKDKIRA